MEFKLSIGGKLFAQDLQLHNEGKMSSLAILWNMSGREKNY